MIIQNKMISGVRGNNQYSFTPQVHVHLMERALYWLTVDNEVILYLEINIQGRYMQLCFFRTYKPIYTLLTVADTNASIESN